MTLKLKNLSQKETDDIMPDNLILLGYRGSIAHGMYVPNTDPNSIDDKDIMGIYMGKPKHYLGFPTKGTGKNKDTYEKFVKEWDCVFYEFRKFVNLLMKANPNVLSMLWLRENHIIYQNEIGKLLRDNRDLFVSKQAYHSFTGYAYGQLKRMTHFTFEGYMGEKRKSLVEKFGFDTKNAAHLVRLLKMGTEFLIEGELHVNREDAPYLLQIKHGKFSLEYVQNEAEILFKQAKEAYLKSTLPNRPDRDKIENLVISVIMDYLRDKV